MGKYGWGIVGATLGCWELAAFTTGRVPTVSSTVCSARGRWPLAASVVVLVWAAGTARHLLTYQP
jgi:hypothetical protein